MFSKLENLLVGRFELEIQIPRESHHYLIMILKITNLAQNVIKIWTDAFRSLVC